MSNLTQCEGSPSCSGEAPRKGTLCRLREGNYEGNYLHTARRFNYLVLLLEGFLIKYTVIIGLRRYRITSSFHY